MNDCVFCKLITKQIPGEFIYEDEQLIAVHDINPAAPIHILIIPKTHIVNLFECNNSHANLLGCMSLLAPMLAKQVGAKNGFRWVINNGVDAKQEIYHLHGHVLCGPHPWRSQS